MNHTKPDPKPDPKSYQGLLKEICWIVDRWWDGRTTGNASMGEIVELLAPVVDEIKVPVYQYRFKESDIWKDCDKEEYERLLVSDVRCEARMIYLP